MRTFLLQTVLLVLLGLLLAPVQIHSQVMAWRKKTGAAGLTVGINPLNPNVVYAEGGTPDYPSLIISYDRGRSWSNWSAPQLALVRQILIHPNDTNVVFAAAGGGGLQRSSDYGATWNTVITELGIDGESVSFDPIHPDTMFAGNFADGKVYRSIDRGATWTLQGIANPDGGVANLCALAIRPDSTNILYAGTGGGSISKSTDYGVTWRRVKTGTAGGAFQETPRIVVNMANPMIAFATTYGAVPSTLDTWKTSDGGESWQRTSLVATPVWGMEADPTDPNILYVGTFTEDPVAVYKTTDGGVTWTTLDMGLPEEGYVWTIKVHPMDPSIVWAAITHDSFGREGIYLLSSSNTLVSGVLKDAQSGSIITSGTLRIPSTGDEVIITPQDSSFSFNYFDGDTSLNPIVHVEAYPYHVADIPLNFVSGTLVSQDISLTPLEVSSISGIVLDSVASQPVQGFVTLSISTLIADTTLVVETGVDGSFRFDSLYVSEPPIVEYTRIKLNAFPYASTSIDSLHLGTGGLIQNITAYTADMLVVSGWNGEQYSSYYEEALSGIGASIHLWNATQLGTPPLSRTAEFLTKSVIYYTGDRSTPLTSAEIDSVRACLAAGGNLFLTGKDIVELNSTSALLQNDLGIGFGGNLSVVVCHGSNNDIFNGLTFFTQGSSANNQGGMRDIVTMLRPGVRRSLHYGGTESGVGAGVCIDSAGVAGGKAVVFGFGFEGIHTLDMRKTVMQRVVDYFSSTTAVEENPGTIPLVYKLEQNYPNPFNPVTEIRFQISEVSLMTLKVYDVLGREVTTLINERKEPGEYSVRWDASEMPSGVYYYRLRAGDYTAVKKMMVMK